MFILVLTILVVALVTTVFNSKQMNAPSHIENRAQYEANNFAIYASALTAYAQFNTVPANTIISDSLLTLTSGFIKGNWTNKVVDMGGIPMLLVYSNSTYPSVMTARNKDILYFLEQDMEDSMTVGYTMLNSVRSNSYNNGTIFMNATGVMLPITAPLPDNTIVMFRYL